MFNSKFHMLISAFAMAITVSTTAALSDDRAQWQFNEFNDPDNKGRMTARLVLGVPETDAVQFTGICSAVSGTSVAFSVLNLSADVGDKKDGEEVELLFSGGGFGHVVKGEVHGTNAEVGVSGVLLRPKHNDKIWTALTEKNELDYVVPGYRAAALKIGEGKGKIQQFIDACRNYAEALSSTANSSAQKPAKSASSGISEKEAFESAKELNTIEAWEAFLNNYNTGFRADLARAYVKRLTNSDSKTPTTSSPTDTVKPTELTTIDPGPGSTPWITGKKRLATTGNKAVYSASVRANGIELVTYCVDWNRTGGVGQGIFAVLREYPSGSYPKYDQRIRDALASAPSIQGNDKKIRVWFSSGFEDPNMSARESTGGELLIGSSGQAISQGRALSAMLSEQTMTVYAPPFSTTIQMTGSRKAVCRMANRCGAAIEGCGTNAAPATVEKKVIKKKKVKKAKKKKRCKKNHEWRKGKCRWKVNKYGFEIKPWEKPGCKTWERQCNKGKTKSCIKYEENCQPN